MVFDGSTDFNGRSINKELLNGPDLTNQLVGVLIKFRQEQVAVIEILNPCFTKFGFLKNTEVY